MATRPQDVERAYEAAAFTQFCNHITSWQREVAPKATPGSTVMHLEKEVEELKECTWGEGPAECAPEIADVVILAIQYADRAGIDLYQAVVNKMEQNHCREWHAPDDRGVVVHKKGLRDE